MTATTALDRAHRDNLTVRRHHRIAGLYLVTSSTDAHTWYRVTRSSCTCMDFAHRHRTCKHMAAVAEFVAAATASPVVTAVIVETTTQIIRRPDSTPLGAIQPRDDQWWDVRVFAADGTIRLLGKRGSNRAATAAVWEWHEREAANRKGVTILRSR